MWRIAIIQFFSAVGMKLWPRVEPFFQKCRWCAFVLFMICVVAISITFFVGCAVMQKTEKAPLYQYKSDIQITLQGQTYEGMAVTKSGDVDIGIVSKAKLDLLTITSCHRNFTEEGIGRDWWGRSGKAFTYHFEPTEIEREAYCPLYIQAFDQNGVAAWGYVAFRTNEKLPARTECNGTTWKFSGISVCQSKAGLEQAISFDRPVTHAESELCEVTPAGVNRFRVRTKKGFCYATFTDGTEKHRLVLLGYDQVLVRGGP